MTVFARAFGVAAMALLLAPAGAAIAFEVTIVQPLAEQGVFGPTEVVAAVRDGRAAFLELYYNDARVATRNEPPWKFVVDVGGENIDRTFRVVATSFAGEKSEALLRLAKIQVDEVLDLSLHQVYVTVTREGDAVRDLARSDFRIFDDGKRQQIVTYETGDAPLAALLAIDSSLSMEGPPLLAAIEGARSFAEGMIDLDEAMLLLFSDHVVHHTEFTGDPETLVRGLTGAEASGGSAINDYLYLALQLLERRQGRRVVVLLSDGIDVESVLSAPQVAEVAARSQALIYWIRVAREPFGMRHRSAWRSTDEHTVELDALAALVDASGGRRIDIASYDQAAGAFREIVRELTV